MVKHTIAIGIGGTGAKCIEAVTHLAPSYNTPGYIYPILVDQDKDNGNVIRCIQSLKAYERMKNEVVKNADLDWFFKPHFDIMDKLLPLVPQSPDSNFEAAIGLPSMHGIEKKIVETLYLPSQLKENLDLGYKKRAHIGSVLIEKMLQVQTKDSQGGLNSIISKFNKLSQGQVEVVVFGSLFGGTGASGIVRIGRYFKKFLPDATIKGVLLTPYFMIPKPDKEDGGDAELVKSDADMLAIKSVLDVFGKEILDSYDGIYILGAEVAIIEEDKVTEKPFYGGKEQRNPAHVMELIAATTLNHSFEKSNYGEAKVYVYNADTGQSSGDHIKTTVFRFGFRDDNKDKYNPNPNLLIDLGGVENFKRLQFVKDFANMLKEVRKNNSDWWERQPWADELDRNNDTLFDWADGHSVWWYEMTKWKKFVLYFDTNLITYKYSRELSKYLVDKNAFKTVEELVKRISN